MKKLFLIALFLPSLSWAGAAAIEGSLNLEGYSLTDNIGINSKRGRGAFYEKETLISGDVLFRINSYGGDGTGFKTSPSAVIEMSASENWSPTANGTKILFKTTPTGSTTPGTSFTIDSTGISSSGTGPLALTSQTNSITFGVSGSATPSFYMYASSMTDASGNKYLTEADSVALPQNLDTTDSPRFSSMGLSVAAASGRKLNISDTTLSMAAQKTGIYKTLTASTAGGGDLIGDFNIIIHGASGTSAGGVYGALYDTQASAGTVNGGLYGLWARNYIFSGATSANSIAMDLFSTVESGGTGTTMYGLRTNSDMSGTNTNYYAIYVNTPGAGKHALLTESGLAIFNEDGVADSDFRVEGDTEVNALFVDASVNAVGFATAAPVRPVDITGAMRLRPQGSPPGSASSGDIYVDSTPNPDELCFYDGAAWQGISSGTDANCQ